MGTPETEFESKIECAWTLASRYYTDPAILEQERRKIFARTWQLAGRLDALAAPGSYFTTSLIGEPIIVVRDLEGRLRVFSNVCRHRAGPVAEGSGCRKNFQCGYHGWTYTLDGRLIGTPDVDGMEFFDRSEFGLVSLRVETWGPFIFATFDPDAPALAEFLEEAAAPEFVDSVAAMRLVERRDYTVECNWKVYVDNYLEGYHIPIAHPELMREIDYANYRTTPRRYSSRQHAPMRRESASGAERLYSSGEEAHYLWIFPNLMLNLYPGNLQMNFILPINHERTLTVFEWHARDANSPEVRDRLMQSIEFSHQVQKEDICLCEAVQRGLRSITYDRGRYSVRRENGVHHFHSLLHEFLSRD